MKGVRALAAIGADDHAHGESRAILVRPQRAKIVGDTLRQHRHDAVGEIDRVAALCCRAVERRARAHVMRDVGNGDADNVAARIARIGVGHRMDRVVMILGVGWIDGDEGDLAPVLASGKRNGPRRLGVRSQARAWKSVRDAMSVDRDQADCVLALDRAEPLDHGARRQAHAAVTGDLDRNEIAVDG